jgi:protein-disulfide isomerase
MRDNGNGTFHHMKLGTKLATFALAAAAVFAQAPKGAFDKPALEAYLRHMELWIPQVSVTIDDPKPTAYLPGFSEVSVHLTFNGQSKDERYYVSSDGKNIVKGEAYDLTKNPFQANLDKLKTDQQPGYGGPAAPVQLIVFGDFQCPLCKAEAEIMRGNMLKTFGDKVRVYFKDFPLDAIHPWARPASVTGRCVYRQNADLFWNFHDWIYKDQGLITLENLNAQVMKWAGANGVDAVQLGRCVEGKETEAEVARNVEEGRGLGVDATPTTFINGRKLVGTMEWGVLQQLITLELDHQSKLADAARCCEVSIPTVAGR